MAASLYTCCRRIALICNHDCANVRSLLHHTRWYARGIRRTPAAVRTPDNEIERLREKGTSFKDPRKDPFLPFIPGDPTQSQFVQKAKVQRQATSRESRNLSSQQDSRRNKNATKGTNLVAAKSGLRFEKLEDGDKRFGQVLTAARSKKDREKKGLILLEGLRLIKDSLLAGVRLKYLYFTDAALLSGLPRELLEHATLYKVQYRHLKLWADTQTPSGILGIFAKPAVGEVLCPQEDSLPLTLICDNIRDPGNMGTIIRTAAAAGCGKIITTKGCVDIWDPKVLRSAMGGHFYTYILNSLPWEQIISHVPTTSYVCIADTRKGSVLEKTFDVSHPKVVNLVSAGDEDTSSSSEDETSEGDEESDTDSDEDEDREKSWSNKSSEIYKRVPLSVVEYSEMDCTGAKEVTVIVGGETEGVSNQAKKFAFDSYGQFVTVPMVEAVDSLNTATATAIVMYEARRQLLLPSRGQK